MQQYYFRYSSFLVQVYIPWTTRRVSDVMQDMVIDPLGTHEIILGWPGSLCSVVSFLYYTVVCLLVYSLFFILSWCYFWSMISIPFAFMANQINRETFLYAFVFTLHNGWTKGDLTATNIHKKRIHVGK